MTGSFSFSVSNKDIEFRISIRRNVTVIRGEGGTGKTLLCKMIDASKKKGSGVHLNAYQFEVRTLTTVDFYDEIMLRHEHENIIYVIDEDEDFVRSSAFAEQVKNTGSYVILITRDNLKCLPCSIHEVYTLSTEYDSISSRSIRTLAPLFPSDTYGDINLQFETVITEDLCAGKQFFNRVYSADNVVSAKSKDNIYNVLAKQSDTCLVIADGAAFGFLLQDILTYISQHRILIILKESFEYVILKSGILSSYIPVSLNLENPIVDAKQFLTWEQFYTHVLETITEGTLFSYNKEHLPGVYTTDTNISKILNVYGINRKIALEEKTSIFDY